MFSCSRVIDEILCGHITSSLLCRISFLGWTDTFSLQNTSVEIRAILLQTTDIVQDDRRRLSAIYRGFPHVRR